MHVLLIPLLATNLVLAHSWYDAACCGDYDCKPVPCEDFSAESDGGLRYLPTGNVFVATQVLPSRDAYCHVCLGRNDHRSLCAYIQQGA